MVAFLAVCLGGELNPLDLLKRTWEVPSVQQTSSGIVQYVLQMRDQLEKPAEGAVGAKVVV